MRFYVWSQHNLNVRPDLLSHNLSKSLSLPQSLYVSIMFVWLEYELSCYCNMPQGYWVLIRVYHGNKSSIIFTLWHYPSHIALKQRGPKSLYRPWSSEATAVRKNFEHKFTFWIAVRCSTQIFSVGLSGLSKLAHSLLSTAMWFYVINKFRHDIQITFLTWFGWLVV